MILVLLLSIGNIESQTLKNTLVKEYVIETEENTEKFDKWLTTLIGLQKKFETAKVVNELKISEEINECSTWINLYGASVDKSIRDISTALNMLAAGNNINGIRDFITKNIIPQIEIQDDLDYRITVLLQTISTELK